MSMMEGFILDTVRRNAAAAAQESPSDPLFVRTVDAGHPEVLRMPNVLPTMDPATPDTDRQVDCSDLAADEEGAIRGDLEAASRVWRAHRGWVAAVLLSHGTRSTDLADLLQDVALSFMRKATTIREPRALRGWLRTVAINAARAARRSGRLRPGLIDPVIAESVDQRERRERGSACRDAHGDSLRDISVRIERLPDIYREALVLRTVRGMSSRQVADLLGISVATVDTRVARARRMLLESEGAGKAPVAEKKSHV